MIALGYYTVLFQVNYERQLKTIIHCDGQNESGVSG